MKRISDNAITIMFFSLVAIVMWICASSPAAQVKAKPATWLYARLLVMEADGGMVFSAPGIALDIEATDAGARALGVPPPTKKAGGVLDALNLIGASGWELVTVTEGRGTVLYHFKRRVD